MRHICAFPGKRTSYAARIATHESFSAHSQARMVKGRENINGDELVLGVSLKTQMRPPRCIWKLQHVRNKRKDIISFFYIFLINSSAWGATFLLEWSKFAAAAFSFWVFLFRPDAVMRSVITVIYRQ